MTTSEAEEEHRPFGFAQDRLKPVPPVGRRFVAQRELEGGATEDWERGGDKKRRRGWPRRLWGRKSKTGPGYLAFLVAFLSAFLAFFAMEISFRRSVVCCSDRQSV